MSWKATALESPTPARVFTADEANAMLPLIRAITSDLVELSREVIDRHQRVEHLKAGRDITSGDPYDDELTQIEEELEKDRRRLTEYVEELRQLGVEPKSGVEGLIDFPSMHEGRLVYLCWKLGEPTVSYWHELDAGYAGRQPLANQLVTDSPTP